MASGLYGIVHSNRKDDDHWGKNCFNSSFPTSMAAYMLENNLDAVYVCLEYKNNEFKVVSKTIPIREVFNCEDKSSKDLYFSFETVYKPYQEYAFDNIPCIDLVVKDLDGKFLAPLEIKLTVLPDNTTFDKPQEKWGSEIVFRSPTTSYCALGIFDSIKEYAKDIRDIFEEPCSDIEDWTNGFEMKNKTPYLYNAINDFEKKYYTYQKPILMQTIWKTQGKAPDLADNAFDIIVWSDYALTRLFVDAASSISKEMSRPQRATARFARCLWELSKSGKVRIEDVYRKMTYGNQNDKECSLPGNKWRNYVKTDRTLTPILPKEVLNDIIHKGFIRKLSPERRFDQTLYFTVLQDE